MTRARGWCPSLFEPMATGDGLLVRVKPPLGPLSADAARLIGAACAEYGNGVVELTARGSLQCRGFDEGSARRFASVIVGAGLASADPAAERRRTVQAPPWSESDGLAQAIEAALVQAGDLAGLPAKFGVSLDGVPRADIAVGLQAERTVVVGGSEAVVDDPVGAVLQLARAFLALGGGRRMAELVARVGEAAIFAQAGLPTRPARTAAAWPEAIGWVGAAFGVGLPFGAFDAATLAGLAERHGDGALRLAPGRSVVIAGARESLPAAAGRLGLIVASNDPRRLVSACPGQPACASATVATRALAASLWPDRAVHVSGCEKGCAHPGPAALTLVGRAGRFDAVRDGTAGGAPVRRGLTAAEALVFGQDAMEQCS